MIDSRSRFLGCLLGLAVGDALGAALEFCPPGSFTPITDLYGGGPFHLMPGQWTDDTSMALCLAESLVECQGFNPLDQMQRYWRWYQTGYLSSTGICFDIGNTTRSALERFAITGEPYCGSADPFSAGNGSLMRLAPVAMFFARDPALALTACANSSRTTHAAPAAVDACRYFGTLLVGALNEIDRERLLSPRYSLLPGAWEVEPLIPEIDEIALGSYQQRQPPAIQGSGYVVRSLEAALWAFYHSTDFRQGCLLAANLGDDADTTAAIYSQLAGAYYGVEEIPTQWLEKLAMCNKIQELAEALWRFA